MSSRTRTLFITMGLLSFLFGGCGNQPPTPAPKSPVSSPATTRLEKPPEVTSELEEGFHDLIFYIRNYEKLPDGSQRIQGEGLHKGRTLAFEVVLEPGWKGGSLGKDVPLTTYQSMMLYRSIGSDSDSFVQVLDELYGTKIHPQKMVSKAQFTAITLSGDPRDLSQGPLKIKLFFESNVEDDYAELYTNIDLKNRRLEVHEKDEGYRSAVIKALTQKK